MPAKMTSEQFIAKAKAGSPSLTVLGQYVNNKGYVKSLVE